MFHIRPLVGDGFPGCEAAACCVFLTLELAKVAVFVAAVELGFDVSEGGLAHAPAKRIPHQGPLVDRGLPLEVAATCIGDGLPRPGLLIGRSILRPGPLASLGYNRFRLVAERCGHAAVRL